MSIERGKYKGWPVLILKRSAGEQRPFVFGLTWAKQILENIEEIRRFVDEYERPIEGKGKGDADD